LIVRGGRLLPTDGAQTVTDALEYRGRLRAYPGALVGMKPPQYAVWLFAQLGARPGDELADLYPGSGAVTEAWRRYTAAAARDASPPPLPRVLSDASPAAAEAAVVLEA
jgi:hypothetical protein